MKTVSEMLRDKGSDIWSVAPETSVFDALCLMAKQEIGAVLVLDNGKLAGIMSERDYARKVALRGKFSKDIPVHEIMSTGVISIAPTESIETCMALMQKNKIRHLPVAENDTLLGLISIGDVVHTILAEKEAMIGQLVNYISGTPS